MIGLWFLKTVTDGCSAGVTHLSTPWWLLAGVGVGAILLMMALRPHA